MCKLSTIPCLFSEALIRLGFAQEFVAKATKFAYHPVNSSMGNYDTKSYKSECLNYDTRTINRNETDKYVDFLLYVNRVGLMYKGDNEYN